MKCQTCVVFAMKIFYDDPEDEARIDKICKDCEEKEKEEEEEDG